MIVGVVGPKESCGIIRKAIHQIDQSHEVRLYTRELVRAVSYTHLTLPTIA